jgi:hypothetical protein
VPDSGLNTPSPKGGQGGIPSLRLWLGVGSLFCLAVALLAAGALARESERGPGAGVPAAPLESATGPNQAVADQGPPPGPAATAGAADPSADGRFTAVASSVEAPAVGPPAIGSNQAPATVVPPAPSPPAPAPLPEPAAARLAREASQRFGIRIVLDGQDWGPDEASQQTNIGAVISVMERLPQRLVSAVVNGPQGPLTFVSNTKGRTLDGWQPYGDFPMGFYTNSDQDANGRHPANEVVLIPGFSDMSIGHEVLHAYHFRNTEPDRYAVALLGDEMRSFMAAAGWRQVGSDQQVLEATDDPWDTLNSLYVYEGRPLTYTTAAGSSVTLTPPNPLEAFAVAGSIYFTRPSGMPLPDWPEYWAWFSANLG